jgi:hypothetical protein
LEVLKFGDLFWDCTLKPIIGNLPVKIEDLWAVSACNRFNLFG